MPSQICKSPGNGLWTFGGAWPSLIAANAFVASEADQDHPRGRVPIPREDTLMPADCELAFALVPSTLPDTHIRLHGCAFQSRARHEAGSALVVHETRAPPAD